ncbi:MAG TPA: aldo/keto reductase [Corynebacterium sp.]|nr:aldo/keto reductase [Corynebacterium sp.]
MVQIARTDIDIFPLNLGANPFGWTADKEATFAILDAFVARGGNFIDTADSYSMWAEGNVGGESEELIGQWLEARPEAAAKVIVATKSGGLPSVAGRSREHTRQAVEDSLKRLQLETIDIFYYHHDDENVSVREQVDIATELIEAGKIRYLALSNYSVDRLREFLETAQGTPAAPVAIQPQYNLLHRKEYEEGYGKLAEEFDVSVFPYFALASGLLTGKYRSKEDLSGAAREGFAQAYLENSPAPVIEELVRIAEARSVEATTVALAWLLAKGVTAPIASVSKVEQLDALIAAPGLKLTEDEVAALDRASEIFA